MGIELGALVLPLFAAIGLRWWKHTQSRVTWWELVLPLGVGLIIVLGSRAIGKKTLTHDTEYWTTYGTSATYHEAWVERVSCRHQKYKTVTVRNRDGTTSTTREPNGYEHSYDLDHHPPEWHICDHTGERYSISSGHFESLASRWRNRVFHDVFRFSVHVDGDMYETTWSGDEDTPEIITAVHSYDNLIQASSSSYNYPDVDKQTRSRYGLFEYPDPDERLQCPSVLGVNVPEKAAADRLLTHANSLLGSTHKIRMWVLLFQDKPLEAALAQEALWEGSNKNELVLCIGIDKENVIQWGHCFSWTKVEELKIGLRNLVNDRVNQKLDLSEVVTKMVEQATASWQKRNWHDFDYLEVPTPTWAVIMCYLLVLASSIGLSYWAVRNEFDPER
jgi:hypothetical protein